MNALDWSRLPAHTLLRLLSIALTFATVLWAVQATSLESYMPTWQGFLFSLGFGHYFLSFVYARQKLSDMVRQPDLRFSIGFVCVLGALLYGLDWYYTKSLLSNHMILLVYFGAHHVFNEIYLLNRKVPKDNTAESVAFRKWSTVFNFCIYFSILHAHLGLEGLAEWLLVGLAVSLFFFLYSLWRLRDRLSWHAWVDAVAFEAVGLVMVVVSYQVEVYLMHVVCYHFIFWIFYPLPQLMKKGQGEVLRYLGLNAGLIFAALVLSPLGWGQGEGMVWFFNNQFYLWSFIHISSSFFLSTAHPRWVLRWFRMKPAAG